MRFLFLLGVFLVGACAPKHVVTNHSTVFRPQSGDPAPRVAAYCIAQSGRKVGNGECWTLANEAFKFAGIKRPGQDLRVWGRVINPNKEKVKPGDVVEFRSARFSNGIITGRAHTAVVVKSGTQDEFIIAEQNWGKKTVRFRKMSAASLIGGELIVYRPE